MIENVTILFLLTMLKLTVSLSNCISLKEDTTLVPFGQLYRLSVPAKGVLISDPCSTSQDTTSPIVTLLTRTPVGYKAWPSPLKGAGKNTEGFIDVYIHSTHGALPTPPVFSRVEQTRQFFEPHHTLRCVNLIQNLVNIPDSHALQQHLRTVCEQNNSQE